MISPIRLASILASAVLLGLVFELIRRRKLGGEHGLIWTACALVLLGLSLWHGALATIAGALGIHDPPELLLLVLLGFVLAVSLYSSVTMFRQGEQIQRLVEEVAVLGAEQREARQARSPAAPPGDHPPAP